MCVAKSRSWPSTLQLQSGNCRLGVTTLVSDAQLVSRVLHGDVEAFGQLAARYERSLLGLALANLRDFHEAEDVVQATLLRAFQRLETLRDANSFGSWLIQIARSQVIDSARVRLVRTCGESSYVGADDKEYESFVDNERLLRLIARLPDNERVLVGLRYFDGHSMSEIAAISARRVGTVTKQLSRAMARLRDWYEEETRNAR